MMTDLRRTCSTTYGSGLMSQIRSKAILQATLSAFEFSTFTLCVMCSYSHGPYVFSKKFWSKKSKTNLNKNDLTDKWPDEIDEDG